MEAGWIAQRNVACPPGVTVETIADLFVSTDPIDAFRALA